PHVVADRLAYRRHPLRDSRDRTGRIDPFQLGARVHLHGPVSGPDPLPGRAGDALGTVPADPSVHTHPFAHRPAEKGVDRHTERSAMNIPQRLIDAGDGAHQDRPPAVEATPVQRLPYILDAISRAPD